MAKKEKQQKKKKGQSVQDMMGIQTFTKYGLLTDKGELLFYLVSPTNISVLSYVNIEIKISAPFVPKGLFAFPALGAFFQIAPRFLARQGKPEKGGGFFVGHGLCFWHNALKDRTPDDQPMAARPAFLLG